MYRPVIYPFQPNIQNLYTRGWGGNTLNERGLLYWFSAGFAMMTLMYDEFLGIILAPYFGLWFPLWLAWGGYAWRHDARRSLVYAPKPRVICDPQGLTCYNAFSRIRYQWRWRDIKNVEITRHPRCLYIEPHYGKPCTYCSGKLEYNDYTAIVVYAQQLMRTLSFVSPPTQKIDIDTFDYYEDYVNGEHLYTAITIIWVITLIIARYLPELPFSMLVWWHKWSNAPDHLFKYTYPLSIAIILYASIKLLSFIGRIHRNLYRAEEPNKYLSINHDGLHFVAKKKLTFYWRDIIDIYLDNSYSQGTIFYHIVLTDRLANKREIMSTPNYKQAMHIVHTVKSVIEKPSSLHPMLDNSLDTATKNTIPNHHKLCYWVNAILSILVIISSIQFSLEMNTMFTQNKSLFIILWSIVIFYFIILFPIFYSKSK